MTVSKLLKDFADGTSIHGLCFMVEKKASLAKRLTWFLLFLASVVYASVQLKTAIIGKLFFLVRRILYFKEDFLTANW